MSEFLNYCDASECVPWLSHGEEGGQTRSPERVVFLNGCWCSGALTHRILYRPTPGRQGIDCYFAANASCVTAKAKFQRWLDKWMRNRSAQAAT